MLTARSAVATTRPATIINSPSSISPMSAVADTEVDDSLRQGLHHQLMVALQQQPRTNQSEITPVVAQILPQHAQAPVLFPHP